MPVDRAGARAWPAIVWSTPVLRRLDEVAKAAIMPSGRVIDYRASTTIYREGDPCDSFFVVTDGAVELRAIRRGDEAASLLRTARAGESFGEEAFLPGLARRLTAATTAATVVEIPIAVLQRASHRADGDLAHRERRYVERAAARDLLACSAFARDLDAADVEILLDAVRLERIARGTRIYEPGAPADALYFVVEGLVQLQREDDTDTSVAAYLARGDFFGDQEALAGEPRRVAAVASGDSWCAIVSRDVVRTLSDRNPGLLPRLRRVAETREAAHGELIGAASAGSTQHVFRDLYRMQMARSLLVIDQDTCVRCGHCAWSCEQTHGTSRLIRRGDKVITQLADGAATLLLPNTCQHCRQAACMIDCPTGAIGRDPEGEVFIRPSLCTGCGNCAKACPWENIQLAPRPPAPSPSPSTLVLSADIAVKCDLCRGFAAPACVEACPTGSVMRLDPQRDVAEVARILGLPTPTSRVSAKPSRGTASNAEHPPRTAMHAPTTASRSPASIGSSNVAVSAETSRDAASNAIRRRPLAVGSPATPRPDAGFAEAARGPASNAFAIGWIAGSNAAVSAETSRRPASNVLASEMRATSSRFAASVDSPSIDGRRDSVLAETPARRASSATSLSRIALRSGGLAAAIAVTGSGWLIRRKLGWTASHGGGLVAGMLAGLLIVALGAYIVPKRVRAKARPRKRTDEPKPAVRSRLRPHFLLHLGLGAILPAAALAHAGVRFHDGTGGALAAALAVTVVVGALAAIMYFAVPPVLTRLERRGVLPEDLAGERETLEARLYQAVTGSSDRVKALVERILMPYARARFGPAILVGSGLRLAEERQRLRREIDIALAGRTPEGADTLIDIAVELRALPARRLLGRMLRVWPPIHAVTGAITLALLVVHIVAAVAR